MAVVPEAVSMVLPVVGLTGIGARIFRCSSIEVGCSGFEQVENRQLAELRVEEPLSEI